MSVVALWVFTALVVYRVLGQLAVVIWAPKWLPPMEAWQSGLVPYWFLLLTQSFVLFLMVSISIDFTRGYGYWVEPRPWIGAAAFYWSYGYGAGMVARYVHRMIRHPDQRWFGGTIPIFFHTVVAAFQWTFGSFQMG
jgi:hypothetical protein